VEERGTGFEPATAWVSTPDLISSQAPSTPWLAPLFFRFIPHPSAHLFDEGLVFVSQAYRVPLAHGAAILGLGARLD
jgi:hypothetical protein